MPNYPQWSPTTDSPLPNAWLREITVRGESRRDAGRVQRSLEQVRRLSLARLRKVAERILSPKVSVPVSADKGPLQELLAIELEERWHGLREALKKPSGFDEWLHKLKCRKKSDQR